MRTPRLVLFWGFLTGVAAGLASAAPPSSIVEPVGEARDRASFTFKVTLPALLLSNLPDGATQVRIDGFAGREVRPGVPDLPFTVVRVALPAGVTPRLVLDGVVEDSVAGAIPQSVPRLTAELEPDAPDRDDARPESRVRRGKVVDPDLDIFNGREPYPRQVAWLGSIGTFRDQRYVDVFVAPVRFDPSHRGLRVARSLTVTVAFDGDSGIRTTTAPDPRIEDLYRNMFANYGQGTTFRLGSAPTSYAAASTPSAPLAGPLYKIRVRANGIVRLDSTRLAGTGFETQPISTYKLTDRGVEVPLLVFDANSNDHLDAGDWVEFYGQALDDEPKTVLNTFVPGGTSIYEARDFSDENVYFMTVENGARARLASRAAPSDLSAPVTKFEGVAHLETDNAFRPLSENDPWFWGPVINTSAARSQSVPLPGLASSTDPVHVIVRLRGRTEDPNIFPDHKSRITLTNSFSQLLGINNDNGTWDGRTIYTHDFTWTYPGSGPTFTNPTQVQTTALSVAGIAQEFFLDSIELRYQRTFQAAGDTLTFDFPDGDAEFQVTGLASSAPEVWELTGRVGTTGVVAPVRITGGTPGGAAGNFSIRFHMTQDPAVPDGTLRRFVVAGAGSVSTPAAADFTADTVSDLRNTSNQADLIVIAHPTPLGATATTVLNSLLSFKLASQGITSKVAMIQDVYDEFGDGLPGPLAIKNFLAYVMSTNPGEGWSGRKPAWVLLIGDGSFDYKYNDTSVPASNFLPTQILYKDDASFGYYASDSMLAAVVGGDLVPDLTVGRIPTRTDAQTATVLQKILGYEQSPPAGTWRNHAVFIADRGKNYDDTEAQLFEAVNAAGRSLLKVPPDTERTMNYWSDYCGGSAGGCNAGLPAIRADIKKSFNGTLDASIDGAAMMQFTGHGNFNVWSDDAIFAENWDSTFDVSSLTNGLRLPWLIAHNCLTGGFEDATDLTLGEDMLKRSGGGAIAVFGPSGLDDGYNSMDMTNLLWGSLFGRTKERLMGNVVATTMNDICGNGIVQTCQNFVLLGDPTTQMVLTAVQPATQLVATAGNANVNLTWTASASAGAKYDVYRAVGTPTSLYTKINPGGPLVHLTTTNYADGSALNAKTYYYAVVALDGSEFESRWSNLNSDCAVSGPDCVTASPTNPNPPAAPTGLTVTDPETSGKLLVSWNPSPETDIDHYTVSWRTAPGGYPFTGNPLRNTSFTITGLTDCSPSACPTYFITVTATNTSGHVSPYAPEVPGTPTFVRGVRSPGFITTLKIDKSGSNAVLTWAPTTLDIYGKPETPAYYEVFRGTTPNFVPSAANKIGQPLTPSWTDLGALSVANPNYHYLVRAVDSSGNVGGLGNQLPYGIDKITMTKTPNGVGGYTLGITWTPVATDFNGSALAINHYEVYAANQPFSRANIASATLVGSPTTASFSLTAPVASQYYSVLAVDARGNKSPF